MALRAQDGTTSQPTIQGRRILNFSNPDVDFVDYQAPTRDNEFEVWPTGTAERNNAEQIRQTACLVAGFEDEIVQGIWLNGPHQIAPGQIRTIRADRRCGGDFAGQIAWQISIDNGPWINTCAGGTFCDVAMPSSGAYSVRVRASLLCSNGQTYTAIHNVFVEEPCGPQIAGRSGVLTTQPSFLAERDNHVMHITLKEKFEGIVSIVDFSGRVVYSASYSGSEGDSVAAELLQATSIGPTIVTLSGAQGTKSVLVYE